MKTISKIIFLVALVASGFSIDSANAQEQSTNVAANLPVAIVDMRVVRQKSAAMATVREQISKYRSEFQSQIQQEEEQLRAANQELARQRSILSPDAFAEERKKFETRLAEVQRLVQSRRQELDKLRDTAMIDIQKNLNEVIAELANEKGVVLVLQREQTILAARSLEITAEVIERLNKKIPSVDVPPPGN